MTSINFKVKQDLEELYKQIQRYRWPDHTTDLAASIRKLRDCLKQHQLEDLQIYRKVQEYIDLAEQLQAQRPVIKVNNMELPQREVFHKIHADVDTSLFLLLLPYHFHQDHK